MPAELLPIDGPQLMGLAREIRQQLNIVTRLKVDADEANQLLVTAQANLDDLRQRFTALVKPYALKEK